MMAPPALCCCWRMLPPWYCRRFSCIRKHHGTTVSTVHCTATAPRMRRHMQPRRNMKTRRHTPGDRASHRSQSPHTGHSEAQA